MVVVFILLLVWLCCRKLLVLIARRLVCWTICGYRFTMDFWCCPVLLVFVLVVCCLESLLFDVFRLGCVGYVCC